MKYFRKNAMVAQLSPILFGVALAPQVALAKDNLFLEEIVVTAQKREQNLQDVGISVTAFSGDQIRKLGFTNSIDVAAQTPGVRVTQAHPYTTGINVRGVSQNDFASHLEAPVAVYVDDAYVTSMGAAHAQIYDIDRVEILRGPQGTLFGRNATGGLVHYVTNRPTEEFEGYAELTVGDYSHRKFEGAVGGALTDQLLGRLSIGTNKHDGILENRIGPDLRDADSKAIRLQLQYNPNDDVRINLKTEYSKDDALGNSFDSQASTYGPDGLGRYLPRDEVGVFGGLFDPTALITGPCPGCDPRGYIEPDNDPHEGAFDLIGFFEREIYNYNLNISWQLDDVALTSITHYFDLEKEVAEDVDASPVPAIHFWATEDRQQFSQEFRLSGEQDGLNWVAGVYYLDFESDSSGTVALDAGPQATFAPHGGIPFPAYNDPSNPCFTTGPCAPGAFGGAFVANFGHTETVESESWAIFGHVEFDLSDALTLVAALRYTEDERDMDLFVDNTQLGVPTPLVFNSSTTSLANQEFENFSAKLQLNWQIDDEVLLYAGYTRGHKAGNFTAPLFIPGDLSEIPHDEEELHSFEVGVKGMFMDNRLRLNASAFYYDYKDHQAFAFVQLVQQLTNLDATVYGGEIELLALPTDALVLQLGVSLLESTVEDVGMPNGSIRDRELSNAPSLSVNGLARYTWSAFDGDVAVQFDFNYNDEYCFTPICHPVENRDSYVVSNARISYTTADENWEIAAFVNNLNDEEYSMSTLDSSFVGMAGSALGNPRWYGATISYRWGN